ncbi:MAG: hypothetical protein J0H67_02050 [Rhodospirillales bacterium]|nr:hypothetical protein [Rhodospirillales bacterium]
MARGREPPRPYTPPAPTAPAGSIPYPTGLPMLDLLYLLIGTAFLGGCVLYAFACERL